MADYVCIAQFVPELQSIQLELRDPTTGETHVTYGVVSIDLTDLTGTNKFVKFREFQFKDATTCQLYSMWVLSTAPELVS